MMGAIRVVGAAAVVAWVAGACGGGESPAAPGGAAVEAAARSDAPGPEPAPTPAEAPAAPTAAAGAPAAPAPVAKSTPAPAPRPQLPLAELLARRDLWPPRVALVGALTIERGVTLPDGHELAVYALEASEVLLDTGTDILPVPVARTDALERAFALKASLSAEQLALTDAALASRPELWPTTVRTTRRLTFQGGKELPVGTEAALRAVTPGGWVSLYADALGDHFQAEAFETDVVARARERLALPEAERTPFFARSLAAALEPDGDASALERADYVLVYRARLGCPRCKAFAPELAAAYARLKAGADAARVEAVFWSDDRSAEDARSVRAAEALPGRAVRHDRRLAAADLATRFQGGLLPLVYLFDRAGNVVAQNHPNGGAPAAADVIARLEQELAKAK